MGVGKWTTTGRLRSPRPALRPHPAERTGGRVSLVFIRTFFSPRKERHLTCHASFAPAPECDACVTWKRRYTALRHTERHGVRQVVRPAWHPGPDRCDN